MNTVIIIMLIALVIFLAWQQIRSRKQVGLVNEVQGNAMVVTQGITTNGEQYINMLEDVWWKSLDEVDQLNLALNLVWKALPVWEKYNEAQQIIYRNSSTGPVHKIDAQLLKTAIEEMQLHSRLQYPASDHKKINQCYNNFVSPVLALQDGAWSAPYPVKKVFLAVYNILKSILEKNSVPGFQNYLAAAINQSIDCLEVSKSYSLSEIAVFLESYKGRL